MKRYIGKLFSGCFLALCFTPVFLLLNMGLVPSLPYAWAICSFGMAALAATAGFLPNRLRAPLGIALLLACLVRGLFLLPLPHGLPLLLAGGVLYLFVLRAFDSPPFEEWSLQWVLVGGLSYIPALIVAGTPGFAGTLNWLRPLLLADIVLTLFYFNQLSVTTGASAQDGRKPPRRIRRGNRVLAAVIAGVVLIVANLSAIQSAFSAALNWLMERIAAFIAWLAGLFANDAPVQEQMVEQGDMGMMLGEAGDPAAFWVILEKIISVIAVVAGAALLAVGLYFLFKKLRKAISGLLIRLRAAAAQLGEGVQEKSESILDWEEIRQGAQRRVSRALKRLRRPPRWQELDARQRVRYTYGDIRAKGRPPVDLTARETLTPLPHGSEMADLYDRARYSDLPIEESEAEAMREMARQGKN